MKKKQYTIGKVSFYFSSLSHILVLSAKRKLGSLATH